MPSAGVPANPVAVNESVEHDSERTPLVSSRSRALFSPVSVSRWKLFSSVHQTTPEDGIAKSQASQYSNVY